MTTDIVKDVTQWWTQSAKTLTISTLEGDITSVFYVQFVPGID